MITRRCHSYTVQLLEARAALRAASRIPPCGPVLNPTAARRKKEGSQASRGPALWAHTSSPLPARAPSPKASHTHPGSYPAVQRGSLFQGPGSQAPQPGTGLLTSEEFLHSSHSRSLGRAWLPVSGKPELEQVSVCLGNSRKGSSVQANPSGLSTAPPAAPASRRVPTPSGPVQQGRGSSFIMAEPAGKGQRAPQSRQQVHPRTPG